MASEEVSMIAKSWLIALVSLLWPEPEAGLEGGSLAEVSKLVSRKEEL